MLPCPGTPTPPARETSALRTVPTPSLGKTGGGGGAGAASRPASPSAGPHRLSPHRAPRPQPKPGPSPPRPQGCPPPAQDPHASVSSWGGSTSSASSQGLVQPSAATGARRAQTTGPIREHQTFRCSNATHSRTASNPRLPPGRGEGGAATTV